MEMQDQTIMAGEGRIGDCFRACIASVIGLKVGEVPHFALLGELHCTETAIAWLNLYGFEVSMEKDDFEKEGFTLLPLHIISGISPRGISHAVVGDTATGEMVHDPHPSRAGINGVNSRLYFFRMK